MCKFEKIQKSVVDTIEKNILSESLELSGWAMRHPGECIPEWRMYALANYRRALDAAKKKDFYGKLHDIASNFRMGLISAPNVIFQIIHACVHCGGEDLADAIFNQKELQKSAQGLVAAFTKTFEATTESEAGDYAEWINS